MPDLNEAIREKLDIAPESADGVLAMRNALFAILGMHPESEYGVCMDGCSGAYDWPCAHVRVIARNLGIEFEADDAGWGEVDDEVIALERAGGGVIRRDGDQITITRTAEVDDA